MAGARPFAGTVVVVTGGAGGLGRALARRFGLGGSRLALLDLESANPAGAAGDLTALGFDALGLGCDITREDECHAAIASVVRRFGGIDVLVNTAGLTHRSAFASTETAVFRRVMDVNFFGSLHATRAALPSLVDRRGRIVVISSIAGFAPLLGRTGYAASKHALHGLFSSLRAELRPAGVSVTLVCPGFTDTGLARRALDGDGSVTRHPQSRVGRQASPGDVADAVFRAAVARRRLVVLSAVGRATLFLMRVAPGLYERLMARSLRGELERP